LEHTTSVFVVEQTSYLSLHLFFKSEGEGSMFL
jgi:hypothetical protein